MLDNKFFVNTGEKQFFQLSQRINLGRPTYINLKLFYNYREKKVKDHIKILRTMGVKVEPVNMWSTFFLAAGASNVGQGEFEPGGGKNC